MNIDVDIQLINVEGFVFFLVLRTSLHGFRIEAILGSFYVLSLMNFEEIFNHPSRG